MKKILNFIFDSVYAGFMLYILIMGLEKVRSFGNEYLIMYFALCSLIIAVLSPFVYFWQRDTIKKLVKQIDEDSEDED